MNDIRALVLACTLKPSPEQSSTMLMGAQILDALHDAGADGEIVRVADHQVSFGVSVDEGDGDEWPALRAKVLAADVVVLCTPIWMGQPASLCKVVLERLDAEISQTDADGRMPTHGKVAAIGVVGNEDGAHHTIAECLQALNDSGFSVAANAGTYWVGEAMQGTDYRDLDTSPEAVVSTTANVAANAVHLARLLKSSPLPSQAS